MLSKQELNRIRINFYKVLGSGSSGIVCAGHDTETKTQYAVKLFDLSNSNTKRSYDSELQAYHRVLSHVSTKYKLVEIFAIVEHDGVGAIIMKKYNCDLFEYLNNCNCCESTIRSIFFKLCLAVQGLHQAGLAHLDIKPENVLMDGTTPYISDFGSCVFVTEDTAIASAEFTGTLEYAPPEISNSQMFLPYRADIYALGVVLHIAFTNCYPIATVNGQVILGKEFSELASDVVSKLLQVDPAKRPNIKQLLEDPWFQET
jgi:serine/threonine protein kinase